MILFRWNIRQLHFVFCHNICIQFDDLTCIVCNRYFFLNITKYKLLLGRILSIFLSVKCFLLKIPHNLLCLHFYVQVYIEMFSICVFNYHSEDYLWSLKLRLNKMEYLEEVFNSLHCHGNVNFLTKVGLPVWQYNAHVLLQNVLVCQLYAICFDVLVVKCHITGSVLNKDIPLYTVIQLIYLKLLVFALILI